MKDFTLGFSGCPNDAFIFYALVNNKVNFDLHFKYLVADVEELNKRVILKDLDVSKVSFHLFGYVSDEYVILPSGSALGKGCGPLLISKKQYPLEELSKKVIAIPGKWTTAHLLLKLLLPSLEHTQIMYFNEIPDAVASGKVDAGVIIHESRFTYREKGLVCIADLGKWWEDTTGSVIPLGGIIAKRDLGTDILTKISNAIKESTIYAFSHKSQCMPFIKRYAQELEDNVIKKHIDLYVNDFTIDLGKEGKKALTLLYDIGYEKGIFPKKIKDDFIFSPFIQ